VVSDPRGSRAAAASERLSDRWPVYTRVALGLSWGALPGLLLLLLGVALGPEGVGLLSAGVLSVIDPAMPVALVALGVLIGLSFNPRRTGDARLLAAASAESALTTAVVAAGTLAVAPAWNAADGLPYWFLALALGVCAASSSAASSRNRHDAHSLSARIGDLDDLLPIVLSGVALAFFREPSPAAGLLLLAQGCGVALVIVLAGWLLLAKSSSESEQRVFTIALLLLLGGAADYLSLSALLSGLIAGLFLEWIGGSARDYVRRDVLHVQHPLLVLVLLVAGARIEFPPTWIVLGIAYLFLRTAGKLWGGSVARRIAGADTPRDLGLALLAPGVLGIAFALNVLRAVGPEAAPVLAIVAFGAIGSDIIGALVRSREARE
jgi:hypothetical protein